MNKSNFALALFLIALCSSAKESEQLQCNIKEFAEELRFSSHPREISRAIAGWRSDLAKSLIATLKIDDIEDEARAEACYLLGAMRAATAVDELARNIAFIDVELREVNRLPRWTSHPCREALVKIGKPATSKMVLMIQHSNVSEIHDLATLTVFQIEGVDIGRSVLSNALQSAGDVERQRLQEAIDSSEAELESRLVEVVREHLRNT